jgi:hypothetical protein
MPALLHAEKPYHTGKTLSQKINPANGGVLLSGS